ncbi:signal peptidase I [Knoellia aerolata]|uniref:Signal peptidase I n=1 Tax=Knoellia aerolata DSM 18566 TaxID=1385519 RepID=A0A0A0K3C2_9MICO|nr:signal peptidase I [Knoellia aerolata]KGN42281.1 signal peptidase [Knoellia aerolata DSM 18566]
MHRFAQVARRCVRALGTLLLLVVTLGCLAYIVPGLLGYERYVITGGSMSGAIERGSVALEKPVAVADLVVGDVITYLPPPDSGVTNLVTHRITTIAPGEGGTTVFGTQGDANPDPDPWIFSLAEGTQPVVEHAVPYVGYAFVALADPQVRMVAIGGPAAVIALLALRDLVGALRPSRTPGRRTSTRTGAGLPV